VKYSKDIVDRWENLLVGRGHSHIQVLSTPIAKVGFVSTTEDKTWGVPIVVGGIVSLGQQTCWGLLSPWSPREVECLRFSSSLEHGLESGERRELFSRMVLYIEIIDFNNIEGAFLFRVFPPTLMTENC
jgi:hypothetical protein